MVFLNVYDVSDNDLVQKINRVTTANNNVLVGGVFHAGVEVYGKEHCYGATEEGCTGVGCVRPRLHPQHTYRTTVPMGETKFSEGEVEAIVTALAKVWLGSDYDLIRCNCISFCNALLNKLGLRRVPGWVDRAARAATFIDDASKMAVEGTREAVRRVSTVKSDLEVQLPSALESLRRHSTRVFDATATEAVTTEVPKAFETFRLESAKLVELAHRQTQPLREAAEEHAQAVSSSLWQWGQDLCDGTQSVVADSSTGDLGNKFSGVVQEQMQGLWQSVQRAHETTTAQASKTDFWKQWGIGSAAKSDSKYDRCAHDPSSSVSQAANLMEYVSQASIAETNPASTQSKEASDAPIDLLGDVAASVRNGIADGAAEMMEAVTVADNLIGLGASTLAAEKVEPFLLEPAKEKKPDTSAKEADKPIASVDLLE